LAKNSSFGFSAFACVLAKTKCAICAVALFSHETQRSCVKCVLMHFYTLLGTGFLFI